MKFFIIVLVLATFLQITIIPFNLVLILLIVKTYLSPNKSSFYSGFFAGLLLGFLSSQNIGSWPAFFLILILIVSLFKKIPISSNILMAILIVGVGSFMSYVFELLVFKQTFQISKIIIESLLSLPVYLIISLWEERFVIKPVIKLKV